jgi:hypothetical protein
MSITPTIRSISGIYESMNDELDKFEKRKDSEKNLKLLIDFESSKYDVKQNQMEIPVIKYKGSKKLKQREVDLRKKSKDKNSLF